MCACFAQAPLVFKRNYNRKKKGRKEKEKFLSFHGKKTGFWRQMTILPTYLPRVQALPSKKNRHLGYVSLWETRSGGAGREGQENRKVKKIQNWKKRVRDSERSFKTVSGSGLTSPIPEKKPWGSLSMGCISMG